MAQDQKQNLANGYEIEEDDSPQLDLLEGIPLASTHSTLSLLGDAANEETKELSKSLVDSLRGQNSHLEKTIAHLQNIIAHLQHTVTHL